MARIEDKRAALARGREAERIAAAHLLAHGYDVLWQNLRLGRDEIDLVVRQDTLLAVVEVRHRGASAWVGGFESIDYAKKRTLLRATRALLRGPARALSGLTRCRIDVIDVLFTEAGPEVRHAEAAVTA